MHNNKSHPSSLYLRRLEHGKQLPAHTTDVSVVVVDRQPAGTLRPPLPLLHQHAPPQTPLHPLRPQQTFAVCGHGQIGEEGDGAKQAVLGLRGTKQRGKTFWTCGGEQDGDGLLGAGQVDEEPGGLESDQSVSPGQPEGQEARQEGVEVAVPVWQYGTVSQGKQQLVEQVRVPGGEE